MDRHDGDHTPPTLRQLDSDSNPTTTTLPDKGDKNEGGRDEEEGARTVRMGMTMTTRTATTLTMTTTQHAWQMPPRDNNNDEEAVGMAR